jgi:linoleate 8R-lipoxygenase/9,12-octadecadienoate 8-hydroperoxide 8R-isomerase
MAENDTNINGKIAQVEQVVAAALRPLPTQTGDGSYVQTPVVTGLAKDLLHFDLKDAKTLAELAKSAVTGEAVNDREYIMERVIQVCYLCNSIDYSGILTLLQLAAGLPSTSRNAKELTNTFLNQLWGDLEHPPIS